MCIYVTDCTHIYVTDSIHRSLTVYIYSIHKEYIYVYCIHMCMSTVYICKCILYTYVYYIHMCMSFTQYIKSIYIYIHIARIHKHTYIQSISRIWMSDGENTHHIKRALYCTILYHNRTMLYQKSPILSYFTITAPCCIKRALYYTIYTITALCCVKRALYYVSYFGMRGRGSTHHLPTLSHLLYIDLYVTHWIHKL